MELNSWDETIETGEEAVEPFHDREFDFREFWCDDIFTIGEDLPDHLRIDMHEDEDGNAMDHFHSFKSH